MQEAGSCSSEAESTCWKEIGAVPSSPAPRRTIFWLTDGRSGVNFGTSAASMLREIWSARSLMVWCTNSQAAGTSCSRASAARS